MQRYVRWNWAFALLIGASGCKKDPPPPTPSAPVQEPKAAAALPDSTTPTAAPAEATPSSGAAPGARPHVAIDLRAGPKMEQGLPKVGEPAAFRLTLLDAEGAPITEPEPLLGTKLLMVTARADLGWSAVVRADELSDKVRGKHEFVYTFPYSGIHRLWFLFRVGGKTYTEEVVLTVDGKPWQGKELPDLETSWTGDDGLAAGLRIDPKEPQTCAPLLLATAWTKNGKPTRMAAEPDAPTTWYIAIDGALGEVVTSEPEDKPTDPPTETTRTIAAKLGGDIGTAAQVKLSRSGHYRVLAIATLPGKKPTQTGPTVVAPFVITVGGEAHRDGCP